jgi:hypothetical protein
MDSDTTPVVVGDIIVVHGLQGRTELNGLAGTLVSFDAAKGRWAVQLAAEIVSIKSGTSDNRVNESSQSSSTVFDIYFSSSTILQLTFAR